MRKGHVVHWRGGLKPHCFLSSKQSYNISTATCLKLEDLKLIRETDDGLNKSFVLTKLGKTIQL